MNVRSLAVLAAFLTALSLPTKSQAPAGAPAGSTAVCNDGTYASTATKRGACSGHKGIKTWFGPTATASATPAPGGPPQSSAAPATTPNRTAATPAPGGGNGQVWVNTNSNVYHCQGDRNYGTTKAGQYMSEADAKAKGARPAMGKTCSK